MDRDEEITEVLEDKKINKKSKKNLIIPIVVLGIILLAIAVFFMIKGQKPMVIAKNLELSEKYLEEGN